jgi:hypothetical protein
MRVVQIERADGSRSVGVVVSDDKVVDVTAVRPEWTRVLDVFAAARQAGRRMSELLHETASDEKAVSLSYRKLLGSTPGEATAWLRAPIDHADPHRVLVTGTGLTHVGGMKSRDQMHADAVASTAPQTDSAKMFAMGIEGGKPAEGERGAAPEWFYKGSGAHLRGPNEPIELPAFALDGGEEPELAGVYAVDGEGRPWRLGFVLANEWSDHATEKINYLYLAPSKLRTAAIGPELVLDHPFQEVRLWVTVTRGGETIYDSGELFSGEGAMCHSLANCEDHHFKYPQHRVPGDVHVHFFGTSKLSYSTRTWKYQAGDVVRVDAPGFCAPLVNTVVAGDAVLGKPVRVSQA